MKSNIKHEDLILLPRSLNRILYCLTDYKKFDAPLLANIGLMPLCLKLNTAVWFLYQ